jgi:hypothetical protein
MLAAAAPVGAQQSVDPLRSQIVTFEDVLRRAIEMAGETLSTQVKQQLRTPVPIQFGFDPAEPVVRGWPIEAFGYHFVVQVPDVAQAGMLVLRMWELPQQAVPAPRPPEGSAQPVAAAGGVVKDDPMGGRAAGPQPAASAVRFDPNAAYRENVRAALIDAIINNPGVLSLRATDTLAVSASGVGQSALSRARSTRVTLYISGADLAGLRDGRLTREEARKRIREQSF